ncbi:putative pentatricopeptide repeat-containing protein [Hordeum vulgare]|nr:putative pentatricopeptide repeat-containing protein [Hordeum vulgare]
MYHLLALDPTINIKFFVTQFLLGLKDELRAAVRFQAPSSITRASVLARIQEEELGTTRAKPCMSPPGRPPTTSPTQLPRAAAPIRTKGAEYARERQLRDFRRANNLCFKCGGDDLELDQYLDGYDLRTTILKMVKMETIKSALHLSIVPNIGRDNS